MNYLKERVRHALAAEYVLGTLRGPARRRFQKLLMQHQLLRETTWMWEQYLNEWGQELPQTAPSPQVWRRIEERLGFIGIEKVSSPAPPTNYKKRSAMWRSLTGLAAAAALVLLTVWVLSVPPTVSPVSQIAVVTDEDATPLWLVEVSEQRLEVRATNRLVPRDGKDFELWMVPDGGGAPISLGLLPEEGVWLVDTPSRLLTARISALAVSLEPPGGSATGSPTEVLYLADLIPM